MLVREQCIRTISSSKIKQVLKIFTYLNTEKLYRITKVPQFRLMEV